MDTVTVTMQPSDVESVWTQLSFQEGLHVSLGKHVCDQ